MERSSYKYHPSLYLEDKDEKHKGVFLLGAEDSGKTTAEDRGDDWYIGKWESEKLGNDWYWFRTSASSIEKEYVAKLFELQQESN